MPADRDRRLDDFNIDQVNNQARSTFSQSLESGGLLPVASQGPVCPNQTACYRRHSYKLSTQSDPDRTAL